MGSALLLAAAARSAVLDDAKCLTPDRAEQLVVLQSATGNLMAVIDPAHGGQLVSLRVIGRNRSARELLYRGLDFCQAKGWDGKAPILWPATGRNYAATGAAPGGLTWSEGGTVYPMPIHGFAKDSSWSVVGRNQSSRQRRLMLELTDSPETRRSYPFAFRVRVTYTLDGEGLRVVHRVIAGKNGRVMPFSIGNHITFAVGAAAAVSTSPTQRVLLDSEGRPRAREAQAPLAHAPLSVFGTDTAYSLAGYGPGEAKLAFANGLGDVLTIRQKASGRSNADPIRFNLWGNPAAGYFSPEPWFGLQNSLGSGQGIVRLGDRESFTWTFSVGLSARRQAL